MRGLGEERSTEKEPIPISPSHAPPGLVVLSGMRVESPYYWNGSQLSVWWLSNSVNLLLLKTVELFTSNGWTAWYINYLSIKLVFLKKCTGIYFWRISFQEMKSVPLLDPGHSPGPSSSYTLPTCWLSMLRGHLAMIPCYPLQAMLLVLGTLEFSLQNGPNLLSCFVESLHLPISPWQWQTLSWVYIL